MAEQKTAVVDPAALTFCEDGMASGRIVVQVPDNPDPRRHRYSGDPLNPIRDATLDELAAAVAAVAAEKVASFTLTSRQKDVLTTCALIVRARGIAAWNALTTQQKVTAALAEANVWVDIRTFIESNT
jgi:hypothetical protein